MEIKLLSCPLCLKPHFEGVDALRLTLVSAATSHLSCPVCSETLLGLDKLTIHLFSHINDIGNHQLNPQETIHTEIDKSIDLISKGEKSSEAIQEKITNDSVSFLNVEDDQMKCDICNFSFTDKNILDMHQKLLHQTSPDRKTGSYSYHCHLCSKRFKMKGSLMVHLRVAHYGFGNNYENECCGKKEDAVETNVKDPLKEEKEVQIEAKRVQKSQQLKVHDNKQWECDVCFKLFTTKYFLKKHKRLHTGEMPYCCSLCNKSFTFQQSYHKHMLYHSSEKPYVCNECGRAFKELSTLQNHARIHSGERPFGCETCGKRFRQRVSYLVHRRIHTGVMPYKCTACEKCFRYKVSQRSHKCPMNPPGSVIRVPDLEKGSSPQEQLHTNIPSPYQNNPKCIMSVDLDTGKINLIPEEKNKNSQSNVLFINGKLDESQDNLQVLNESIFYNTKEQIEISNYKADLQPALNKDQLLKTRDNQQANEEVGNGTGINNNSTNPQKLPAKEIESDLFSMVLSPILPEVESLCLDNSSANNSPISDNMNENITTMGEKCLEEFLYGTS